MFNKFKICLTPIKIFSFIFLAVVKGDSFEDIFEKVKNVIDEHAGPEVWLPNKDRVI